MSIDLAEKIISDYQDIISRNREDGRAVNFSVLKSVINQHLTPSGTRQVEAGPAAKTVPLQLPTVELYENAAFLYEQIGGLSKGGVECEVSRSLSGFTLFVNVKGDKQHMAALNLRPIISEMAELLTRESA